MTPSDPGMELARARPDAELTACQTRSSLSSKNIKRSVETQNPDPNHPVTACLPQRRLTQWSATKMERKSSCGCNEFLQAAEHVAAKRFSDTSPEIITNKSQNGKSNSTCISTKSWPRSPPCALTSHRRGQHPSHPLPFGGMWPSTLVH